MALQPAATTPIPADGADGSLHSPVDGRLLPAWSEPGPEQLAQRLAPMGALDLPREVPLTERCAALRALADALEGDAVALAEAVTLENGCPAAQAEKLQVHSAVALLRAMAQIGEDFPFTEERRAARGGTVRIEHHPAGPALGIVPWNVPIFLACAKLASGLLAGCPTLLKPSPENTGSMTRFAGHLAALGLPDGAVDLLVGGRELGASLVANPLFRKVSFTGSTEAGRAVAVSCAARFARCTLELGGKSAAILLDDVDFSAVADELFLAMLQNNGQVCGAQSRLLVPRSRYDELVGALAQLFLELVAGDPRDPATQIGPVVSVRAAARIRALCRRGEAAGARRLAGADSHPDDLPALVRPHLYEMGDRSNPLWTEEIFGPVIALRAYDDEDEAVALANDSAFGLSGSVWSADAQRAGRVASMLRTGTVGINSKKILDFAAPFGGWRESGVGREFGPEGIREYLEAKSVLLP